MEKLKNDLKKSFKLNYLANRLGFHRYYFYKKLEDIENWRVRDIKKLAEIIGMDLKEFMETYIFDENKDNENS